MLANLETGYQYLLGCLNDDGGVPAVAPGDVSGVWTTAEALDTLLSAFYFPYDRYAWATRMCDFILAQQLDDGGWPLVKNGARGSTMTTGCAVAALVKFRKFFAARAHVELLDAHISKGIQWLQRHQNGDGGWGVEPTSAPQGAASRTIATTHALIGFSDAGFTIHNSNSVVLGTKHLLALQMSNGGFSGGFGHRPDACNTARAIRVLLACAALDLNDPRVHRANKFVLAERLKNGAWSTSLESFVVEGSSGEIVFNSNTPADVLFMLSQTHPNAEATHTLAEWFLGTQEHPGAWGIVDQNGTRSHIQTWTTSEALRSLDLYQATRASAPPIRVVRKKLSVAYVFASSALLILESILLSRSSHTVYHAWISIPAKIRSFILGTIIVGLLINLASSVIFEKARNRMKRSSDE